MTWTPSPNVMTSGLETIFNNSTNKQIIKLAKQTRQWIEINLLMQWPVVLKQYLKTAAEGRSKKRTEEQQASLNTTK